MRFYQLIISLDVVPLNPHTSLVSFSVNSNFFNCSKSVEFRKARNELDLTSEFLLVSFSIRSVGKFRPKSFFGGARSSEHSEQ